MELEEHVNDDDDNDEGSCQASPPACFIIIKHTDAHSRWIGDWQILLDGQGQPHGMHRGGGKKSGDSAPGGSKSVNAN